MSSMSELATAVANLHAAEKAARAMAEAADAASQQRHHTEMLSQIASAYGALNAAQDERSRLLDRIREFESIEAIRKRYKLVSLGAQGVVAFAPRQPDPDEAAHHLCGNCLNAGKASYLQQTAHGPYVLKWHCNACGEDLHVDTGRPRPQSALPERSGGPDGWMGR